MRRLGNLKNILLSCEQVASLSSLCTDIFFGETSIRFLSLKSDCVSAGLKKENSALVNNLKKMGVDIQLVRKRQPGVLQRQTTNENGLKEFLQAKGANAETIISIISRYPRAITRSSESLTERWEIWRDILMTDAEIVTILKRSPESFFRSGNNMNLKENIDFFCSLGLTTKDLSSMLTRVPRAFSNSVELNKQMVALLKDICINLGGKNPDYFVKRLLSRNVFILLRSMKQVTANVELLQTSFNLDCETLQTLLLGQGADILDLSTVYVKKSFANIKEKLLHHGCTETEINTFVLKHLRILYLSTQKFNQKIDYLLQANINIHQILKCPPVLELSINTISTRLDDLKEIDFNFEINGIDIIALNKKRYEAKFAKLKCT